MPSYLSGNKGTQFLITSFMEAITHGNLQRGSLYGASVIARLNPKVDTYNLRKKALRTLSSHMYRNDDGYWYLGGRNEHICSVHDQLIVLCSSIYSFSVVADQFPYAPALIDLLVPSVPYFLNRLETDLHRTIGGEVLLSRYLQKLVDLGILPPTQEVMSVLEEYKGLMKKKIASQTDAMLYYIEGFEESEYLPILLEKARKYVHTIDNIEVLAFLANHKIPQAYNVLHSELRNRDVYVLEAFTYGEIFNISWQFYILLNAGILPKEQMQYLADISIRMLHAAGFDTKTGVSISRKFVMKDADSTAMACMLFASAGTYIPLEIFSLYRQEYEGKEFFGSYLREIRPSMGTMAHILDAISFASPQDPLYMEYVDILHNNLKDVIEKEIRDGDKWHTSRWYFYSNALISYSHILASFPDKTHPLYESLRLTREELANRIIWIFAHNKEVLTCEESAWLILGLGVYMRYIENKKRKDKIKEILLQQRDMLRSRFYSTYRGNVGNLEKMWIVKVAYAPLNVLNILIHSSLMLVDML